LWKNSELREVQKISGYLSASARKNCFRGPRLSNRPPILRLGLENNCFPFYPNHQTSGRLLERKLRNLWMTSGNFRSLSRPIRLHPAQESFNVMRLYFLYAMLVYRYTKNFYEPSGATAQRQHFYPRKIFTSYSRIIYFYLLNYLSCAELCYLSF
jgi:hypothetical protein